MKKAKPFADDLSEFRNALQITSHGNRPVKGPAPGELDKSFLRAFDEAVRRPEVIRAEIAPGHRRPKLIRKVEPPKPKSGPARWPLLTIKKNSKQRGKRPRVFEDNMSAGLKAAGPIDLMTFGED